MSGVPEDSHEWRVWAARRVSRARQWQESTRRDLAQLGLSHAGAHMLIVTGEAPEGLSQEGLAEARLVISIRRALKKRLWRLEHDACYPQPRPEEDSLREAARQVAAGADVFAERAELAVALTNSGLPERMMPNTYSPTVWTALLSGQEEAVYDALCRLPQTSDIDRS